MTPTPVPVKLSVGPHKLNFGKVKVGTTSKPKFVTIKNPKGNRKHPGISVLIDSPAAATNIFGVTDDCPATLIAKSHCRIALTCTPASADTVTGMLSIEDNAIGNPQGVDLKCTGK